MKLANGLAAKVVLMDDVRGGDLTYARRQTERFAKRNHTGKCHLDPNLVCKAACFCSFEHKVESCAAFIYRGSMVSRCGGVPTNCDVCVNSNKPACGWVCARWMVIGKAGGK